MPYIHPKRREVIDKALDPLSLRLSAMLTSWGDFNYVITRLLADFMRPERIHYNEINAVIGVLECAKLELYRRMAAPHEDKKCRENGDVYPS